jgi:hypothetical protein
LGFRLAIWSTYSFIIKFIMEDSLAAISLPRAHGTIVTIMMPGVISG